MNSNTNPDSPDFVPSRTYYTDADKEWDLTLVTGLEGGSLIGMDAHFTGREDQNYSNTHILVIG